MHARLNIFGELEKERHINDKIVNATAPFLVYIFKENYMIQYKTQKEMQEKWVKAIKDCGQSLIDNAEKIAGDFDL